MLFVNVPRCAFCTRNYLADLLMFMAFVDMLSKSIGQPKAVVYTHNDVRIAWSERLCLAIVGVEERTARRKSDGKS